MNLSLPFWLLFALIGLFATVAVGQTPCSSSARVRCNIHCRSHNKLASCVDGECLCIEKPTKRPA
uniref:Invertebrate defensins family profile domain-containing protein n=1 Tax=Anopheles minimus TaxID=112268 RepID=A0A2C9H6F5_9DIPT